MNSWFQNQPRRILISALAGVVLALCFPPYFLPFLLPIPFFLLYGSLRWAGIRERFRLGFAFAFVFYGLHTYWFASFHPIVLPLMLVYLGLVFGLGFSICSYAGFNPFSGAVSWMAIQGFLGYGYHAFPWSRISTALALEPLWIQPVRHIGEWAWGGMLVLFFFLVAEWIIDRKSGVLTLCVSLVLIGFLLEGGVTFYQSDAAETLGREVLLVQPSVASTRQHQNPSAQLGVLNQLTVDHARSGDLVIWPETALMREPLELRGETLHWAGEAWKQYFRNLLSPGFDLFTGLRFTDPQPAKLPRLNGAVLLESPGLPRAFYTKRRPVPGGEHLPAMGYSETVKSIGRFFGTLGYRGGKKGGLIPIEVNGETWEAGVQICFEDAFSQHVRRQVRNGADLLINISNDSWSRSTASHWQHFYRAKVRAIETGRMVLRNGNTGVSGLIDPRGRVDTILEPYKRGVIRGKLKSPLVEKTIHTKLGEWIPLGLILLFVLGFLKDKISES